MLAEEMSDEEYLAEHVEELERIAPEDSDTDSDTDAVLKKKKSPRWKRIFLCNHPFTAGLACGNPVIPNHSLANGAIGPSSIPRTRPLR